LLLDLRKNGGGDQSGNAILARLASASIIRYQVSERVSDFTLHDRTEYFALPGSPGDLFARWHNLRVSPIADPSKLYLNKPVMALTSPNCFSACDTFASALKTNHLATMLGEATGGGTGTPLVFELPFSKMRFRYSVVRGHTATGEAIEGVGTSPDTVLEPTQAERVKGHDTQLLSALGMLAKQIEERNAPLPSALAPTPLVGAAAMSNALRSVTSELGPVWAQEMNLSPSRSEARALRKLAIKDEL
jgi:C-terminal processing protease CtpA/Prc